MPATNRNISSPSVIKNPYYSDMQNRTRIKICGITRVQDALHAADCGADSIGLVFHPPSPRFIDLAPALEIRRALPPFVTVTALFLDESEDWIAEVVQACDPIACSFMAMSRRSFAKPGTCPISSPFPWAVSRIQCLCAQHENAQGFLFDSNAAGRQGGSGDTFDWSKIPPAFEHPLILAGGINPSNVADAIVQVKPWAVDVSTGVEASRGVKSSDLIDQFFRRGERGDARHQSKIASCHDD